MPQCKAPREKFIAQSDDLTWAAEHVVGVAKGVPQDIIDDLRSNFNGECSEVGMYLAMARVAHREGISRNRFVLGKGCLGRAEHAAKFAELLGEVLTDSTAKNLAMRIEAENGATMGKTQLAKRARNSTWTLFTTPFTKWQETKHVTAKPSKVCTTVTSKSKIFKQKKPKFSSAFFVATVNYTFKCNT